MKFSNYGFIMKDAAYTDIQKTELKTDGFITTVYCVGNNEMAAKVAVEMAEAGTQLVELCGAFKADDAQTVIDAVAGKTAVGFASMSDEQRKIFFAKLKD